MAVLGLVLRELVESILPRRQCASRAPLKAKFAKFLDALLRQFALLLQLALTVHPRAQRSFPCCDVAVAVLPLVLHQLFEALVPRRQCASKAPVKAKRVKFSDAPLGQLALALSLPVHPCAQRFLTLRDVAMSMLGPESLQLAAPIIPFLIMPITPRPGIMPITLRVPLEAKSVKFLDAILGKFGILARCSLLAHPSAQSFMPVWNVAVVMVGLEILQLVVPITPFPIMPITLRLGIYCPPPDLARTLTILTILRTQRLAELGPCGPRGADPSCSPFLA